MQNLPESNVVNIFITYHYMFSPVCDTYARARANKNISNLASKPMRNKTSQTLNKRPSAHEKTSLQWIERLSVFLSRPANMGKSQIFPSRIYLLIQGFWLPPKCFAWRLVQKKCSGSSMCRSPPPAIFGVGKTAGLGGCKNLGSVPKMKGLSLPPTTWHVKCTKHKMFHPWMWFTDVRMTVVQVKRESNKQITSYNLPPKRTTPA